MWCCRVLQRNFITPTDLNTAAAVVKFYGGGRPPTCRWTMASTYQYPLAVCWFPGRGFVSVFVLFVKTWLFVVWFLCSRAPLRSFYLCKLAFACTALIAGSTAVARCYWRYFFVLNNLATPLVAMTGLRFAFLCACQPLYTTAVH